MKTDDPHWYDLVGARLSRRDFVRIGRDVAGLMALGSVSPCRGDRTVRLGSTPFPSGVASGDPSADGAVLWTRLSADALRQSGSAGAPVAVRWEVSADEGFTRLVREGANMALPELGHSVHVEVEGLEPDRQYWYRFMVGGDASPAGRTRTLPLAGGPAGELSFAFASCQNYEHGYYTAYRHMAADDLDLVFHLGDYIYERRFEGPETRRHEAGEVQTLAGYRDRHGLYRSDPDLQAAHAAFPWVVTTDDHEVDNNWADEAAEDDQSPDQLLLRRVAAFQAFYEFMPLRRQSMPSGPDIRLYRTLHYGDLADFHVLDGRQYRSDQACRDRNQPVCDEALNPERTMLGPAQERWLYEGLGTSSARWNVLANQVMVARLAGTRDGETTVSMDRWDGYVVAQRRLLSFLDQRRPTNPVVLTGDIHSNWAADLKADFDDPSSRVVAAELVGTSISDRNDRRAARQIVTELRGEFLYDTADPWFPRGSDNHTRLVVRERANGSVHGRFMARVKAEGRRRPIVRVVGDHVPRCDRRHGANDGRRDSEQQLAAGTPPFLVVHPG